MLKQIQLQWHNKSRRRVNIVIGSILAIMIILVITRIWASIVLQQKTHAAAIPYIQTIRAARTSTHEHITLPGNLLAWHEAPIYARTNGYVKKWLVDIGDRVKEGALLAVIETPELNAQLRQADADLNVVIAQSALAQITALRWRNLLKTDSVSKQETDEKIHTADALTASVVAARANRDRLRELVGFEQVIAPFEGTISARGTDIGALINAGSNPDAKPLFSIVQSDPLRLYIKIPETYSSRITSKMTVNLRFAEHPGQRFQAQLFQTANAIDINTRTLLTEFVVQNKNGELLPGSYTSVNFSMPVQSNSVLLPVNTLIFRAEGLQIATLDKNNHVVLKKITIVLDLGTQVLINTGVKPGEQIIINPSDSIYQGQIVRIAEAQQHKGPTHK